MPDLRRIAGLSHRLRDVNRFMLLEAIANGAREAPVLPIEVLNPVHEWRPVFQLGIVIVLVVLLGMVAALVDPRVAGALAILCVVALPAFTGALAVGSSTWHSLNPVALWHIARSLAASYVAIVAVVLSYGFITRWLVLRHCPSKTTSPARWVATMRARRRSRSVD